MARQICALHFEICALAQTDVRLAAPRVCSELGALQNRPRTSMRAPPSTGSMATDDGLGAALEPNTRRPAPIAAATIPAPPTTSPASSFPRAESICDCGHVCVVAHPEAIDERSLRPASPQYDATARPTPPAPISAIGNTCERPPLAGPSVEGASATDGAGVHPETVAAPNETVRRRCLPESRRAT